MTKTRPVSIVLVGGGQNQGYFTGRYADLKAWLAKPGNENYLRNWRAKRRKGPQDRPAVPATGERGVANNAQRRGPDSPLHRQIADIQDEIRSLKRSMSGFQPLSVASDIQDEIRPRIGSQSSLQGQSLP